MSDLQTILAAKQPLTLSGVPTGFLPSLLADLARAAAQKQGGRAVFVAPDDAAMRGLLVAVAVVLIVGIADDMWDLRWWVKMAGQVLAGLAVALGVALILAALVVAVRNPDPEKVSAYECGFNAMDDARMKFDVRFYLVSILFIIFDLEVAFLFPCAVAFGGLSLAAFWSMMIFLLVLTIGFAYEWKKGALEWQ